MNYPLQWCWTIFLGNAYRCEVSLIEANEKIASVWYRTDYALRYCCPCKITLDLGGWSWKPKVKPMPHFPGEETAECSGKPTWNNITMVTMDGLAGKGPWSFIGYRQAA